MPISISIPVPIPIPIPTCQIASTAVLKATTSSQRVYIPLFFGLDERKTMRLSKKGIFKTNDNIFVLDLASRHCWSMAPALQNLAFLDSPAMIWDEIDLPQNLVTNIQFGRLYSSKL